MKYIAGVRDISCGRQVAEHVKPELSQHRVAFNRVMDELQALDPSCPTTRL